MQESTLTRMADILPMAEADTDILYWLLPVAMLIVLWLGYSLWQRYLHPLARLDRRLRDGRISSREAAHALARIPLRDVGQRRYLDHLRFRRQPPDLDALMALIRKLRDDR